MKITKEIWLYLVLPAAGIIAIFIFLARPGLEKMRVLDKDIEKANSELLVARQIVRGREELRRELEAMQEAVDYYERKIPRQQEIPLLLMDMSRYAREAKIKYFSINPLPLEKMPNYIKVPIQLRLQSGYHALGRFLSKLENSPRFLNIEDINISAATAGSFSHSINLLINTFISIEGQ